MVLGLCSTPVPRCFFKRFFSGLFLYILFILPCFVLFFHLFLIFTVCFFLYLRLSKALCPLCCFGMLFRFWVYWLMLSCSFGIDWLWNMILVQL